jgi:hypothetical protein
MQDQLGLIDGIKNRWLHANRPKKGKKGQKRRINTTNSPTYPTCLSRLDRLEYLYLAQSSVFGTDHSRLNLQSTGREATQQMQQLINHVRHRAGPAQLSASAGSCDGSAGEAGRPKEKAPARPRNCAPGLRSLRASRGWSGKGRASRV